MLRGIAERLDRWIVDRNVEAREEGLLAIPACKIQVLGQFALIEGGVPLTLAATKDVDVRGNFEHGVRKELERLLRREGYELDPVGHEIWMPRETRYADLFVGAFVRVLLAEPDAVLLSKALKAPKKNAALITEYVAQGASERFLKLATKYGIDLEQFV